MHLNQNGIGVIGYKIGTCDITYETFKNVKNTQLELFAVDSLIEKRNREFPSTHITIHSDCQAACTNSYYNVSMNKIRAHKKKSNCDDRDLLFRQVDIGCRKKLRELSRNVPPDTS